MTGGRIVLGFKPNDSSIFWNLKTAKRWRPLSMRCRPFIPATWTKNHSQSPTNRTLRYSNLNQRKRPSIDYAQKISSNPGHPNIYIKSPSPSPRIPPIPRIIARQSTRTLPPHTIIIPLGRHIRARQRTCPTLPTPL